MTSLRKGVMLFAMCMTLLLLSMTANAATYKYDDLGRVIEVTYDSGQKIQYTYDAGGNLLSAQDISLIKLNPIGNKTVSEGQELKFTLSGVGQKGSILTYSASNLPEGASISSQTGIFSWTPSVGQAGVYSKVIFKVTDGTNISKQEITITVKSNIVKGDMDGSGEFNSIDFACLRMYLLGTKKDFTTQQLEAADVDNNGLVNAIDFAIMRQVILGIKYGF